MQITQRMYSTILIATQGGNGKGRFGGIPTKERKTTQRYTGGWPEKKTEESSVSHESKEGRYLQANGPG